MKYTTRQYAEALHDALSKCSPKEQKEMIIRFYAIVRKNGDSPRMELIFRAFEKKYLKEGNIRAVDIEMVDSVPESVKKEIKNILGGTIVFSEKKNPDLTGGIRITIDGELLIDASAQRQIDKMLKK